MLKILFVAAEAYPLSKSGGLGDVAGALPAALRELGADVRLMMPAYRHVLAGLGGLKPGRELGAVLDGLTARTFNGSMPDSGVPLTLLDCPPLFDRDGGAYQTPQGVDWPDNHVRFGLFSRAAAMLAQSGDVDGWRPDLVHAHDWHTGLLPCYLRAAGGAAPPSLFTIHNMAYQGQFHAEALGHLQLRPADFTPEGLEFWGRISFLKSGLVYANALSTVSPTYAREIQQAPFGAGLEGILASRHKDLSGILNGVDCSVWDPASDPFIGHRYAASCLGDKRNNSRALREEMHLSGRESAPLFGVVSRLVDQKGIDLVAAVMPQLLQAGAQLAILGSGDKGLEDALLSAARAQPGDVAVHIGFDEAMAHRVIAGCDVLLVPSRFEPCGLTQLYAQRYGTLPLVHRTGGLADTVHDGEDGYIFDSPTPQALLTAAGRAMEAFRSPEMWRTLQLQAMARDVSWGPCARQYLQLYHQLIRD